ncbi:hypothetical protein CO251_02250 [Sulfobacillus sp. hq2]|nr:hypothetical protein CO251_02250 [Sulfobacillus sp. hq2]
MHWARAMGEAPDAVFELLHGVRFRGQEQTPLRAGDLSEEREVQKIKRCLVGIYNAGSPPKDLTSVKFVQMGQII